MQAELKERGIDEVLSLLEKLPREVVSKRGGAVKLALKKGAKVLRNAAAANLQAAVSNANDDGERFSTGFLLANLITSRGKPPFDGNGERYLVRVRRKAYPDRTGKGKTTTSENAARLEYGTADQPAEPWLRPAFNAKASEAITVIQRDLVDRVEKLARQHLPRS